MRFLVLFALLAACNTPSPHFKGIAPVRITVDGSVFDVRVRGNLAEAIRTNSQYAPRFGPIQARAAFAMARVSGCKVRKVTGDAALATGHLSCPGQPHTPLPAIPLSYSCVQIPQWAGLAYTEFECDPVRY